MIDEKKGKSDTPQGNLKIENVNKGKLLIPKEIDRS